MAFCTRCGTPRTTGANTCDNCGHAFGSPAGQPVYEESQPTTWDYSLPPDAAPGSQPEGWGYYDEPQRLAPDRADAFWDSFAGPPPGPAAVPPSPPYPPQAAQPASRPPASHRYVPARPAVRRRPGPRGSLVAAVALLVLACGGGTYAIVTSLTGQAGNNGATDAAGAATSPAASSSPLTPSASVSPTGGRGAATATPGPSSPSPSATSQAPATTTVTVSPGARADSAEPMVAGWLGRYFRAINTHDYQAYVSLLDSEEAAHESQSDFTSGYSSTTDSAATLTAISDLSGGGEAATVSFTSHQAAGQSVNDSTCDRWTITLYLEPAGSSYVVVPPPAGYRPSYESC